MSEWKLSELCIGKGSYGIGAPAVDYDENLPTYLRITDINDDGSLNINGFKSVDDAESSKYTLKENDIVFARTGNSTGRSYFYNPTDGTFVYAGFLIKFSLDPTKVNPKILKYYTHSQPYYDWVKSFDTGATRGNINAQTYGDMTIDLPERNVQDRIVTILSSLDAKIENNNKVNAKLEEIAQNLFKEWFVDFGPFKDGKFVDSELGPIPEGWRVGTLGEILDIKYGKDHKKLEEGNIPVYGSGGLMRFANKFLYDKESVLIPRKGTLNNIMYVTEPFWTVDTMFYSEIKIPNSGIFTYQFLSKKDMNQLNSGTSIPSMTTEILNKQKLVIPSDKTFLDYYSIVKSLYERIKHNELESIKISNLRDTLLPKLMSGEIEV